MPFEGTSPLKGILQVDWNIYNICENYLVPDSGKAYRRSRRGMGYEGVDCSRNGVSWYNSGISNWKYINGTLWLESAHKTLESAFIGDFVCAMTRGLSITGGANLVQLIGRIRKHLWGNIAVMQFS